MAVTTGVAGGGKGFSGGGTGFSGGGRGFSAAGRAWPGAGRSAGVRSDGGRRNDGVAGGTTGVAGGATGVGGEGDGALGGETTLKPWKCRTGRRSDARVRHEVDGRSERERPRDHVGEDRGELARAGERRDLFDLSRAVDHPIDPEGQPIGELRDVQRVDDVGGPGGRSLRTSGR